MSSAVQSDISEIRQHYPVFSETKLDPANDTVQEVERDGREYLVFPIIALREMVLEYPEHNSSEYLPAEHIRETAHLWTGIPLVYVHPENSEKTAATPDAFVSETIGQVFRPKVVDGDKLRVQAWLDKQKALDIGGLAADVVDKLLDNQDLSVSAGYATLDDDYSGGQFNANSYDLTQGLILPDHVAIFPSDEFTARCDWADGCGAPRANAVDDSPGSAIEADISAIVPNEYSYELQYNDVYRNEEDAVERADNLGCSGTHSHDSNGRTVHMPCDSHEEYERVMSAQADSNRVNRDERLTACEVMSNYTGVDRALAEDIRSFVNAYVSGDEYERWLDTVFDEPVVPHELESVLNEVETLHEALHATMDHLTAHTDLEVIRRESDADITFNQQEGWPEVAHDGLCESINGGSEDGFFTACMEHTFDGEPTLPDEPFCAWLHHYCFDKWPAEGTTEAQYYGNHNYMAVSDADGISIYCNSDADDAAPADIDENAVADGDTMTEQDDPDPATLFTRFLESLGIHQNSVESDGAESGSPDAEESADTHTHEVDADDASHETGSVGESAESSSSDETETATTNESTMSETEDEDTLEQRANEMTLTVEDLAEHTMFSAEALEDMDEDVLEMLEQEVIQELLGSGAPAEAAPEDEARENTEDDMSSDSAEQTTNEDTTVPEDTHNFVTEEDLDARFDEFQETIVNSVGETLSEQLSEYEQKQNSIKTEENVKIVANAMDISDEAAESLPEEDFERKLKSQKANYSAVPGEMTRNYEDVDSLDDDFPAGGRSEWEARQEAGD